MDDAGAHQTLPYAIGNGPGEAAVLRVSDQLGKLAQSLGFRRCGVDRTELWKEKTRAGVAAGRLVAAVDLQRVVRDDGAQRVGVVQLPTVDEAIVARSALHVDAEEHLRDILRELQLRHLAGVDVAAP